MEEITTLTESDPNSLSLPKEHPALPAAAYLASLGSEDSRRGMVTVLNNVAGVLTDQRDWKCLDWRKTLNAAVVDAVMAKIKGSPATRNKTLSAIKGTARAAYRLDWITGEAYTKIKDISGDKGSRQIKGRDVSPGEISELMRVCSEDSSPAGARDAAIIAFLVSTGARRAEATSLAISNLNRSEDGDFVLSVIGKGNKERTLYLNNGAAEALRDWLEIRGVGEGAIFCRIDKSGTMMPELFISPTALDKILKKRSAQAGVKNVTLHDFRRTTAGNLLDHGADISTVASILGHSSVTTTQRYDRRGERAKKKASQLLSVPYFGRVEATERQN